MEGKIESKLSTSASEQGDQNERNERDLFNAMKQISDFAKVQSNGWISVKETSAPNVGLVETRTTGTHTEIKMSAMANLEEICNLFGLSYQEESGEDGVAGEQVIINNRDELAKAIKEKRYIAAWLREQEI